MKNTERSDFLWGSGGRQPPGYQKSITDCEKTFICAKDCEKTFICTKDWGKTFVCTKDCEKKIYLHHFV